jgi:predicted nucleic acid-binding protein
MRVIADTSPLHYLVLIEHTAILPVLFGRMLIPRAVAEELQHPRTPASVRAWISSPPEWLEVHAPRQLQEAMQLFPRLGAGEQAAIALVQEVHANLLLIDDLEGRETAERLSLAVMGTLRVLELAAERGLLDLPTTITRLQATSFYTPANLVQALLARDAVRKASLPESGESPF